MTTGLPLLSLQKLEKRYESGVDAVSGFDLDVMAGEFITLLGPSGSGKTSVLKMIAGFERPSAGDILFEGGSILEREPYERGMGMVFQSYALFPHMTVAENIAFPLDLRRVASGEIDSRVRAALEMVRLPDLGSRYPGQLSGGQQQRVALARAVVSRPRVVLMDEPLGALDRNLREQLKAEIKSIQRELGMTAIYVTHDQDEALVMSDRIAVMHAGRLVQLAPPKDIYSNPCNRFVASFVGESNLIACTSNGNGTVRLAKGRTLSVMQGSCANQGSSWLLVRPEAIDIGVGDPPPDGFQAVLREVYFLGELTRYLLDIGGETVVVKKQNCAVFPANPGDPVWIRWSPADARLLDA